MSIYKENIGNACFTLHPIFTPEECQQFIECAENHGFEKAMISSRQGAVVNLNVRSNDRVIWDDPDLAERIWQRVKNYLPVMQSGREIRGLNERFRYYRYTKGQIFRWHYDGYFARDNGEESVLTFLIYLNEGYEGGETRFTWTNIKGKTGMGLVFPHNILHEGGVVLGDSVKYVIRTDVMYGPVGKFTDVSRAEYYKNERSGF
jgi:prolyl 4-hydroxylase